LVLRTAGGFFNYTITQFPNYKIQLRKEFMANTTKLSRDERKKVKRTARKKRKADKPLKPRDYPRGSKKPKVKKLARGQAKR
jgi:mRNA-degrading endonuclease RelE of RelBE toxin-antitoxin system